MRTRFSSSEPMQARFGIEYASPELQEKSVTPSESEQVIEPDSGVYGLSKVTVGAIDSEYVGSDVPRKSSSDLTASGDTVSVPSGYYPNGAQKTVASGSATVDAVSTTTPSIMLSNDGLITAIVNAVIDVTPTVTPGYIANGTQGTVAVTGTQTYQMSTANGSEITPNGTTQTAVTAGKYTKGAIIVKPIPSEYVVPTGTKSISANGTVDVSEFANANVAVPWNPLGEDAELIQTYDMVETKLSDTTFNGWTPSTTAKTIKSSGTLGTISSSASALDTYEYVIYSVFDATLAYASGTTLKGAPVRQVISLMQHIHRKPGNLTNLASATDTQNYCVTVFTASLMDYYNINGSHTLAWTGSYGLYPAAAAATFSSSTSASPTITVKSPAYTARCSTSYFTTTMAAAVDQTSSKIKCKVYVYRIKKNFTAYKMFHDLVEKYNS